MLIIFDLDGTLLNTLEDLCDTGNYILSKHHHPTHPLEAYKQFVGNGMRKLIERALPEEFRETEYIEQLFKEFLEYYEVHKADKTHPYDGMVETLETLQAEGIQLAVASNKAHSAMAPLMAHFFPSIRFVAALGNKPGANPKPAPDIVLEIMKLANETAATTLYVGDSCVDMLTARNAGLRKVGVLWGFRSRKELVDAGADFLMRFPNAAEFLQFIRQL